VKVAELNNYPSFTLELENFVVSLEYHVHRRKSTPQNYILFSPKGLCSYFGSNFSSREQDQSRMHYFQKKFETV
jgi:hypothetical protein